MNKHPFAVKDGRGMAHKVNLDALIRREDFELREDTDRSHVQQSGTLSISELESTRLWYTLLRKPDFQRETSEWDAEKIAELISCFVNQALIPSLVLWQSKESNKIFVIDGAHRLSALMAWVLDDYGDGSISRRFFDEQIPPEQRAAAEQTRGLVKRMVGTYRELNDAVRDAGRLPAEYVARGGRLATTALPLQWVPGDAANAEQSFFMINQQAAPIDSTELRLIKARQKANAIASRAIIRAGVGHKYWSAFSTEVQEEVESLAKSIYETLYRPFLDEPIKTLDLPVAGRGYSAESMPSLFDFVNLANNVNLDFGTSRAKGKSRSAVVSDKAVELPDDKDGAETVKFLKSINRIAMRISGDNAKSLGLHPAVYFYSATGKYQPAAFLAVVDMIKELEARQGGFLEFTDRRARLEDWLSAHRDFINQIVKKYGSGKRSFPWIYKLLNEVLDGIGRGWDDKTILVEMLTGEFHWLSTSIPDSDRPNSAFNSETKSAVFLRQALDTSPRCSICGARMHVKAISVDHIQRREDGGKGEVDNGQLAHPFCNTGYKEHKHHQSQAKP